MSGAGNLIGKGLGPIVLLPGNLIGKGLRTNVVLLCVVTVPIAVPLLARLSSSWAAAVGEAARSGGAVPVGMEFRANR